jgi:hypothetical protein
MGEHEGDFMAVKVKDAAASAQKFVQNASVAGPAYSAGVANAGPTWSSNTAQSADSWQQGVTAAATNGRFASSITPAAQQKYQTRSTTVGAQRYPQGVQGSQQAWQTNTTPYLQTIANLTLPARQPKGSPNNVQRVAAITTALRAKKLGTSS